MPLSKLLSYPVIFFSLTPWASWGTNTLDSQPWPAIFSFLYFCTIGMSTSFPKKLVLFSIYYIFIVVVATFFGLNDQIFLIFRAYAGYWGMLLVFVAFFDILRRYGFPRDLFILINLIWIIVGLVEVWFPELVVSFSPQRTTSDRGVTSLAPEPTFFAVYLIFNSWILLLSSNYRLTKSIAAMLLLNLLSIVVLAKSAMGVLFVFVGIFIYASYMVFNNKFNLKTIAIFLLIFVCSMELARVFLEDSRIISILNMISDRSILDIIRVDASINARIEHVVLPVHAMVDNIFLPHGYVGFNEVRNSIVGYYNGFFWYGGGDKIMSWVGAYIFDMGIFGVTLIFGFLGLIIRVHNMRRYFEILLLFLYLLAAIPIGFSLVPLLVATIYYCDNFSPKDKSVIVI